MPGEEQSIDNILRDREVGYLLSPVRITLLENLPAIQVGEVSLEASQAGTTLEVPRWVAEIITRSGLADMAEESLDAELFKAISRERIQGSAQLASLKEDFHLKVHRHLSHSSIQSETNPETRDTYEKLSITAYDLVTMRMVKVIQLAASRSPPLDIFEKITLEEKLLFNQVQQLVNHWRSSILGGT